VFCLDFKIYQVCKCKVIGVIAITPYLQRFVTKCNRVAFVSYCIVLYCKLNVIITKKKNVRCSMLCLWLGI